MGRNSSTRLAGALAVAGLLAVAALPAPAAAQVPEAEIRALTEGLQNGTLPLSLASEQCREDLAKGEDAQAIAEVMSTYLEVPEELALAATCQAIMRAIKANEVTADALLLFAQDELDAAGLFEAGRVMRAIYFSHRLTTTASASGQAAR